MGESQAKKSTESQAKRSPNPEHGSMEHIAALGGLGVHTATWMASPDGNGSVLTNITFFESLIITSSAANRIDHHHVLRIAFTNPCSLNRKSQKKCLPLFQRYG